MIFYDTETCGLCGPVVLIQWARDDGPVNMHSVWHMPIINTLNLIEMFMEEGVCGFNLVFDHFQLCKIYTMFSAWKDYNDYPIDIIDELAMLEPKAMSGMCLKPRHCLDLMLHARKGPYQSTMDREDIRIKRVPTALAYSLAEELNKRIPLNPIYFARNKNNTQWHVLDTKVDDNTIDQEAPEFRDIILKFAPSSALKALAVDIGLVNKDDVMFFHDIDVDSHWLPVEYGFAPYALAGTYNERGDWLATYPGKWRGTWPEVIEHHITHWTYNERARKYAELDVIYTRKLYQHFDSPEVDDDDSVLACMVGAVRWHGLKLDVPQIKILREEVEKIAKSLSFVNSPDKVLIYIKEPMDEIEGAFINSTKKIILEDIAKWEKDGQTHPSALRAQEVLKCRNASKEVELYDKLIQAGRFFPSFKIIGTLSTRMSGSDGLNPQGIKRDKRVRACFPLNHDPENYVLCGGDYDSFEVVLADAEYNDPELRKALLNGKKIHAIFGQYVFIPKTYDEILNDKELYTRSKNAVFAMLYGGEAETLKDRLGVDIEVANEAYRRFTSTYVEVGKARVKVFNMFCSMRQPNGIGSKVEWHEPADYIESLFGFRRYFTLENKICHALFDLAQDPPKAWKTMQIRVVRRDREQTVSGACQSALFASAFAIQAAAMRAACNHRIQSSGAQITKKLQRNIWDVQPIGASNWMVLPINIHDEVLCVTHKSVTEKVKNIVNETNESYRARVPLIKMEWKEQMKSWAEK